MKRHIRTILVLSALAFLSCRRQDPALKSPGGEPVPESAVAMEGRTFKVFIVMDTTDPNWSVPLKEGFQKALTGLLSARHAQAAYTVMDTKLDTAIAAGITATIEREKPDLVCTFVYPSGFANVNITQKLKGSGYAFVSIDPVPVEDGTIASWEKPGGNVTGAGIFAQMNSSLRILKRLRPEANKLYFYSWDQMGFVNEWLRKELVRACAEEGIELAETRLLANIEDELAYLDRFKTRRKDQALFLGITAYVNRKGEMIDAAALERRYHQELIAVPQIAYEDTTVAIGLLFGACVIWNDLGAQLAEKGFRVMSGGNPGDMPWDYPRKYNLVLNLATAKRLGIVVPPELLGAAYRIYTDYSGNFMGKGD